MLKVRRTKNYTEKQFRLMARNLRYKFNHHVCLEVRLWHYTYEDREEQDQSKLRYMLYIEDCETPSAEYTWDEFQDAYFALMGADG